MDEWYYKGVAYQRQQRYDYAIKAYDKALSIKPQSPKAWYNKGNSLAKLKRPQEAIIAYDKALSYFPQFILAYLKKGNILSALKIHPHFFDALYFKGRALEGLKRNSEARENYAKVLEIDPYHVRASFRIGLILIKQRKYVQGIQMMFQSIKKVMYMTLFSMTGIRYGKKTLI
jgi:tetratricopeptide (TPR) repeat protein